MEPIIILLLIIILVLLVKFRNYVTHHFKRIESDIRQLQDSQSATAIAPPKIVEPKITEGQVKRSPEDYWQPSFKIVELLPPQAEKNTVYEETLKIKPAEADKQFAGALPDNEIAPPLYIPARKLTFFERNPDLEKFIGENLVSKIGIAILVLAIGFFVKFAIDNNWIGPVGRVGIGMLCGGILVFLAHRLRKSYKAFSSVLVGGGLAVFYFTITLAYHQFSLFSQTTAFVIMVIITVFAVVISLLYDREELAIIALVGGFAAPFLVSNGSGNYKVLFTYLIILNSGLLITAYNKAWRLLNILAFIFTVILFTGWLFSLAGDTPLNVYGNALTFAAIFYLLFFFINIANNIKENKKFVASDFSILLINTALFFAAGLYCLGAMNKLEYNGLFTMVMGVFNLVASYLLFRKRNLDTNVLYLLIGITLTFISLAAPIQLHGNNITLFWASEAVLLFWLFQKSKISIIQYASAIVWFAMLFSLLWDWVNVYVNGAAGVTIIVNKAFITGIYCAVASYLLFILKSKTHVNDGRSPEKIISKNVFRVAGVVLLFLMGALEINYQLNYYFQQFAMNVLYLQLYGFAFIWLLLFITGRIEAIKISTPLQVALIITCLIIFLFCVGTITELLTQLLQTAEFIAYFNACWIVGVFVGSLFYKLIQIERAGKVPLLTRSELVVWLTCAGIIMFLSFEAFWIIGRIYYNGKNSLHDIQNVFIKTCLPILWGVCSFCFMWLGMKYKFKPLRIISLVLFLITLLKLFIFDISNIPVAGKIAAFFCLGILLLIVSFMYQRLKNIIILDEEKKPG